MPPFTWRCVVSTIITSGAIATADDVAVVASYQRKSRLVNNQNIVGRCEPLVLWGVEQSLSIVVDECGLEHAGTFLGNTVPASDLQIRNES